MWNEVMDAAFASLAAPSLRRRDEVDRRGGGPRRGVTDLEKRSLIIPMYFIVPRHVDVLLE